MPGAPSLDTPTDGSVLIFRTRSLTAVLERLGRAKPVRTLAGGRAGVASAPVDRPRTYGLRASHS
jgi:hypothetical protein